MFLEFLQWLKRITSSFLQSHTVHSTFMTSFRLDSSVTSTTSIRKTKNKSVSKQNSGRCLSDDDEFILSVESLDKSSSENDYYSDDAINFSESSESIDDSQNNSNSDTMSEEQAPKVIKDLVVNTNLILAQNEKSLLDIVSYFCSDEDSSIRKVATENDYVITFLNDPGHEKSRIYRTLQKTEFFGANDGRIVHKGFV